MMKKWQTITAATLSVVLTASTAYASLEDDKASYDKQAEEEYKKQERQLTYKDKDGHLLPPEFYEKLDENVKNIAMTYIVRPYWDRCIFNAYGAEVYIDEKVMETIIPDFVNGNTATMEVFLVKAGKKAVL